MLIVENTQVYTYSHKGDDFRDKKHHLSHMVEHTHSHSYTHTHTHTLTHTWGNNYYRGLDLCVKSVFCFFSEDGRAALSALISSE